MFLCCINLASDYFSLYHIQIRELCFTVETETLFIEGESQNAFLLLLYWSHFYFFSLALFDFCISEQQ